MTHLERKIQKLHRLRKKNIKSIVYRYISGFGAFHFRPNSLLFEVETSDMPRALYEIPTSKRRNIL